jgi:simple sugar transport system permease protein
MAKASRRSLRAALLEGSAPFIGFLASAVVLVGIVLLLGETPGRAFDAIYKFTLRNSTRIASVLSVSIPFYLSGIAVAIAFKAGVFNIGVEGQYFMGALTASLAGIYLRMPPGCTCRSWCSRACSAAPSGHSCPRC